MRVEQGAETRISDSEPDPFVGRSFDGYRVDEVIGRGGMGVVYKATQLSLNRAVAIKVLPADFADHPQFLERFHREVDILSRLSHPNVVTVFERGEVDGRQYLVMEFVNGTSLRDVIKEGPLPPAEALTIVRSVLAGLEHAHHAGIVHRDIKPENVLIAPGGIVKVADFGLSVIRGPADLTRLTHTHLMLGTFEYMAPEQREKAKEADERSDLYATGVVLYELLAGELPIGHFEPLSAKRPGECDQRVDDIIRRSLDKQPERRYQRASEMGDDVSRLLSHAPAEPVAAVAPAAEKPRRRKHHRGMEFGQPWSVAGILCGLWMMMMMAVFGFEHGGRGWILLGGGCSAVYWIFVWQRDHLVRAVLATVVLTAAIGGGLSLMKGWGADLPSDPDWFASATSGMMETSHGYAYGAMALGELRAAPPAGFEETFDNADLRTWLGRMTDLPFGLEDALIRLRISSGKVSVAVRGRLPERGTPLSLGQIWKLGAAMQFALERAHPDAFVRDTANEAFPWDEVHGLGLKLPPPGATGSVNWNLLRWDEKDRAAAVEAVKYVWTDENFLAWMRDDVGLRDYPEGVRVQLDGARVALSLSNNVYFGAKRPALAAAAVAWGLQHRLPGAFTISGSLDTGAAIAVDRVKDRLKQ